MAGALRAVLSKAGQVKLANFSANLTLWSATTNLKSLCPEDQAVVAAGVPGGSVTERSERATQSVNESELRFAAVGPCDQPMVATLVTLNRKSV